MAEKVRISQFVIEITKPGSGDFPAFTPLKLVLDLATPEGCKAELTWAVVIFQNSLLAKNGHLSQK